MAAGPIWHAMADHRCVTCTIGSIMLEVKFKARKRGSIGITYWIKDWVKNDPRIDEMAARVELSEKYEHISHIEIVPFICYGV